MGLCYYSIGSLENALEQFEKSLALNADYEKARSWQDKVRAARRWARRAHVARPLASLPSHAPRRDFGSEGRARRADRTRALLCSDVAGG